MNPLDWNGELFLTTYIPYLVMMLVAARMWQTALNQPSEEPRGGELELDAYQVAVLEQREAGVRAAVAALVHAGALRLEDGGLKGVGEPSMRLLPFERAVLDAVASTGGAVSELNRALASKLDAMEEGLRRRGLLMEPEVARRYKQYPRWLFFGAGMGLGLMKLMVGLSRGRPVGYLVMVLLGATVIGFMLVGGAPRRTRRGDLALARLRVDNAALRTTASADGAWGTMNTASVALAVGLFGTGMLAASGVVGLRDYLVPPGSASGGGDGSVDFGGDGGGGGDSGGGDGGGGGCGGCGGGCGGGGD